eukprot:TRINITY_DN22659_c0_g1_i2.p1 TRINITY_DN22659_c0_g1~~TRINITY_DN22659_c0_g1_i2.p1  ORF type:complete len:167 (-),score=32.93 TRINITY_DN22659_c0_g1_i2:35-535(-)
MALTVLAQTLESESATTDDLRIKVPQGRPSSKLLPASVLRRRGLVKAKPQEAGMPLCCEPQQEKLPSATQDQQNQKPSTINSSCGGYHYAEFSPRVPTSPSLSMRLRHRILSNRVDTFKSSNLGDFNALDIGDDHDEVNGQPELSESEDEVDEKPEVSESEDDLAQ